jgi:hypothetical protein
MFRPSSPLIAVALSAAVVVPTGALAASSATPRLKSSPQMRRIDTHHATLTFAADRLPTTTNGRPDAAITFANGARVSSLKATGTHGSDIVYSARVTARRALRAHAKYTVRFRLGASKPVTRKVKLFLPGEHSRT